MMTTERFIIFLLLCGMAWMYFYGPQLPDPQRSSQPLSRPTAAYNIDTSAPATVTFSTPIWPTAVYATAVPSPTYTPQPVTSDATPQSQRGEQGNERGCASTRSCDD